MIETQCHDLKLDHLSMTMVERAPVPVCRHYVMCPPTFFAVTYAINPWMNPSESADADVAMSHWTLLRRSYEELGHRVELLEPLPDMPDMVFRRMALSSLAVEH